MRPPRVRPTRCVLAAEEWPVTYTGEGEDLHLVVFVVCYGGSVVQHLSVTLDWSAERQNRFPWVCRVVEPCPRCDVVFVRRAAGTASRW